MKHKYKYFSGFAVILFSIITDQWSKLFLIQYLKTVPGLKLQILPFFDCVFAWNHGASFGLLANYYQYSNIGFFVLNSFITIYLIWLFLKSKSYLEIISFALLIGGALGNLIDRIIHGAVFDFIRLHYLHYDFPVFNIADSYVTIGSILLFIEFFIGKETNDTDINRS